MTVLDLIGYKLTFSDEFNVRSISKDGASTIWADIRSEWKYDAHSDIGFGKSSFVDPASGYDPFRVGNGALTITAVPDKTKYGFGGSWESGLIHTKESFSQTYGYFEMRADLSDSVGSWDAFWMLPVDSSNSSSKAWQELDIVEHYGANNNGVYSSIHTTDERISDQDLQVYSQNTPISSGYHTYGMEWTATTISFYVDGILKGTRKTPNDMHSDMYLLANLATNSSAKAPMSMSIDYIRAYSKDLNAVAVALDTISAPDGKDPGLYGASSKAIVAETPVVVDTETLQVLRLYIAALDREPDPTGLRYHVSRLDAGMSLADVAGGFTGSPEFQMKYGALSDTAFVDLLYQNVLDRGADTAGLVYHVGCLEAGLSREDVLIGFSESPENYAKTAYLTNDGIWLA